MPPKIRKLSIDRRLRLEEEMDLMQVHVCRGMLGAKLEEVGNRCARIIVTITK